MEFKAGMEKVDLEALNDKLNKLSVGTYYQAKVDKDEKKIHKYIEETLAKINDIDTDDMEYQTKVDNYIDSIRADKVLNRTFIHIDMDAFYASVEEYDFPHLKGKPVGVGTNDMLVTSNYIARQYGIRAGIPGSFCIGICPQLIIQPSRMDRYREISAIIQKIFATYDPCYVCPSLDEACLEITGYLHTHPGMTPVDVAASLQGDIFDTTTLTCSMGIAYSPMLAKICSEVNKPNGYFYLEPDYQSCLSYISPLPVKKIPGIGKVRQQLLTTMGLSTISEVYENRYDLYHILQDSKEILFKHALAIPVFPTPKSFKAQKKKRSISKESSCKELYNRDELTVLARDLYTNLVNQLKSGNLYATNMVVKIQNYSFHATYHSIKLFDTTSNIQQYFDQKQQQKRDAGEIEKSFKCPVPDCTRAYASPNSVNMHCKLKHPEFEITDLILEQQQQQLLQQQQQQQQQNTPTIPLFDNDSNSPDTTNINDSYSEETINYDSCLNIISPSTSPSSSPPSSPCLSYSPPSTPTKPTTTTPSKSPSTKTPKAKREYLNYLVTHSDFNEYSEKIWNNFINIVNKTRFEEIRCLGLQLVHLIPTSPPSSTEPPTTEVPTKQTPLDEYLSLY
ncbi:hypothetical protein CYY_000998 [Polysphondylium violaceum]|uniref:DNA polymerase kappa n=1 Tax=Polysphondylium violaceum TaxID=133409 RepID=A0A8J4Q3U0_9MYCE|nr:hypothetical protein CYY_000998 [Polysphondylium violaceum]